MIKQANELNVAAAVSPETPKREISVITSEIKELCRQAQKMVLMYAVEIGRRLCEAKAGLPHGEWGNWLRDEVSFSQSCANNYMKLYEEYGSEQISIFGAVSKSEAFENLPYTKALQLLSIPSDEREAFAEEVDAENLSTRELEKAIRERNEAVKAREEAEARAKDAEDALCDLKAAERERDQSSERLAELEKREKNLSDELKKIRERNEALERKAANPSVPKDRINEIKAKAEADARKKMQEELDAIRREKQTADADRIAAQLRAQQAEERLAEVNERAKYADPAVAAFRAIFDGLQATVADLRSRIEDIRQRDAETADKLSGAMKALGEAIAGQ